MVIVRKRVKVDHEFTMGKLEVESQGKLFLLFKVIFFSTQNSDQTPSKTMNPVSSLAQTSCY